MVAVVAVGKGGAKQLEFEECVCVQVVLVWDDNSSILPSSLCLAPGRFGRTGLTEIKWSMVVCPEVHQTSHVYLLWDQPQPRAEHVYVGQ